jgi:1-pyrroline-5-carboxylate dehydrogenase
VINLVTGSGRAVSEVALARPELAGIHFTGSTGVFHELWRAVGANIDRYANYPRVVGETGGKDFVLAHPSADVDALRVALVRGAFEYQGQKCSAASRAYLPASLWRELRDPLAAEVDGISVGDISDFSVFMGAVIDDRAYDRLSSVVSEWRTDPTVSLLAGGRCDDREGWFVWPTVAVGTDPGHQMFSTEYFGPLLSVYVWDDSAPTSWTDVLALVDRTSPYGLTGAIFARDRVALRSAADALRYAAGNLYFNDKPTGAVVGQQPFGGARASGTDDKAGSAANLMRWVAPRVIKETFVAPTDYRYPHMG